MKQTNQWLRSRVVPLTMAALMLCATLVLFAAPRASADDGSSSGLKPSSSSSLYESGEEGPLNTPEPEGNNGTDLGFEFVEGGLYKGAAEVESFTAGADLFTYSMQAPGTAVEDDHTIQIAFTALPAGTRMTAELEFGGDSIVLDVPDGATSVSFSMADITSKLLAGTWTTADALPDMVLTLRLEDTDKLLPPEEIVFELDGNGWTYILPGTGTTNATYRVTDQTGAEHSNKYIKPGDNFVWTGTLPSINNTYLRTEVSYYDSEQGQEEAIQGLAVTQSTAADGITHTVSFQENSGQPVHNSVYTVKIYFEGLQDPFVYELVYYDAVSPELVASYVEIATPTDRVSGDTRIKAPTAAREGDVWILTLEANQGFVFSEFTVAGISLNVTDDQTSDYAVRETVSPGQGASTVYEIRWTITPEKSALAGLDEVEIDFAFSGYWYEDIVAQNKVSYTRADLIKELPRDDEQNYTDIYTIVYHAPIYLHNLQLVSANKVDTVLDKDGEDPEKVLYTRYAINKGQITLSFSTTHRIEITDAYIAGLKYNWGNTALVRNSEPIVRTDNATNTTYYDYKLDFIIPEDLQNSGLTLWEDEFVSFALEIDDSVKNDTVKVNFDQRGNSLPQGYGEGEPFDLVGVTIYYGPLTISEPTMKAEDPGDASRRTDVAKGGDTITVTLKTSHPVEITNAYVDEQEIEVSAEKNSKNEEGKEWILVFTLRSNMLEDQVDVPLKLTISDKTGQSIEWVYLDYEYEQDDEGESETPRVLPTVKYYAPIVLSNAAATSDNARAPGKYAKEGDTISVTFTSNHEVNLADGAHIAGGTPALRERSRNGLSVNWVASRVLGASDVADKGRVGFAITVSDVANNTPKTITDTSVKSEIIFYAPIEAVTSIQSDGKYDDYAKNGDTVTVYTKTNHEVEMTGTIAGRGAGSASVTGADAAIAYTIPAYETAIPEGLVQFSFALEDPAGNTLDVDKTNDAGPTQVIYDRTAPTVGFAPAFNGISKDEVTMTIVYSDENLDGTDLTLELNGQGILGSVTAKNSYSFTFTLGVDGEYRISARCEDMAGNESVMDATAWVIIDSGQPVIRLREDAVRTYKGGFVLADIFEVESGYLWDINCTLTDTNGVHNWELETPITEDGKKTVYLAATNLAGNTSVPLTFDFYIDGTAPQMEVAEASTNTVLKPDAQNTVHTGEMTLRVRLADLHIGDEGPDQFTQLVLLDENGGQVADLLAQGADADGYYTVSVSSYGSYELVASAIDDVGNETGMVRYAISFQSSLRSWWVFASAGLVIALLGGWIWLRLRRRKLNNQEM